MQVVLIFTVGEDILLLLDHILGQHRASAHSIRNRLGIICKLGEKAGGRESKAVAEQDTTRIRWNSHLHLGYNGPRRRPLLQKKLISAIRLRVLSANQIRRGYVVVEASTCWHRPKRGWHRPIKEGLRFPLFLDLLEHAQRGCRGTVLQGKTEIGGGRDCLPSFLPFILNLSETGGDVSVKKIDGLLVLLLPTEVADVIRDNGGKDLRVELLNRLLPEVLVYLVHVVPNSLHEAFLLLFLEVSADAALEIVV